MIILPGQKERDSNLETSGGKPDLKRIKAELEEVQQYGNDYFRRTSCALDWWGSRWDGQSTDGRKWYKVRENDEIFPWPGSSDTRVRLTKMLVNEYRTLCMYGLMNLKLQAKSTRPSKTAKEANQATVLINWQIFNHMMEEWHRETELAVVTAAAFGSSIMSVDWEQERRLDRVPINVMQFAQWVSRQVGQNIDLLTMQDLLSDPSYDNELAGFVQDLSEILSKSQAKSILRDLRDLRTADVPVPYIFRSKPRLMALRPMIDVFFSPEADDLQRERWVDRVEYVTEAVVTDRIETDNYDPGFVAEIVKRKGVYSTDFGYNSNLRDNFGGFNVIRPGRSPEASNINNESGLIELHHFYHYSLDMGVPCLYRTVFHHELDEEACHGISEYTHGQMPFHAFRFETDQRPILSSQGIPETTYPWEQEAKVQFDLRTDLASLKMAPPMLINHNDIDKIRQAYQPNKLIPTRPNSKPEFALTPPYDPGAIQIGQDIMARAREYFGWFGNDLDPQLKQMRVMEVIDRVTTQFKPVVAQIGMLDDQFLPDDIWLRVTGLPPRKGARDRMEIQGNYEIIMTCDPRELDNKFLAEKFSAIAQILPWDVSGIIDRTPIVQRAFESIDYTLADEAVRDPQEASQKEISDEISTLNRIVGSGLPEPLPATGNFKLRLQTMQSHLTQTDPEYPNPSLSRPDVQKILKNRDDYFTRQIQQQENAKIGRLQVGNPFDKAQAPQVTQGVS